MSDTWKAVIFMSESELQRLIMKAVTEAYDNPRCASATKARRDARREQGRANSYEALLAIEKQRGYKPGWARHIIEARHQKMASTRASNYGDNNRLSDLADSFRP